ncbi:MAG TPA: Uma2 family endonuclease [Actinospica sp.]|jgi:Uma2 family endonuclease|nr:Uma2 family endonuclease [Actinospica sp.]
MSVMTSERETTEVIRALHEEIDPPEGYRVEIFEGNIVVSATPFGKHAYILMLVREAVEASLPAGYKLFENTTLEEPGVDRYIPDLAAWPLVLVNSDAQWAFPGEECLLAVEVTSPHQESRDYAKAAAYARSRVPVYLIVDRTSRMCVLFTEPEGDRYLTRHEVPFGKPVTVPLDQPVTIQTSEF